MYKGYRTSYSAELVSKWDRVVLVTGASAGIGKALTVEMVKIGFKVAACARRVDLIKDLLDNELKEIQDAEKRLLPIACDLRDEEQILAMFQQIKDTWGGVDICINNGGVFRNSSIMNGDTQSWLEMIQVNVLALAICAREALRSMRERNVAGDIINICSIAGHVVVPNLNFYSSTKFAVTALTEGLRQELLAEKSPIRVSQISNGYTDTDLGNDVMTPEVWRNYLETINHLTAKDIVEAAIYIASAPPHVQIHDVFIHPINQPGK